MKINKLRKKYFGEIVVDYETKRSNESRWEKEQIVVLNFLKNIRKEEFKVLDVPVGTGRFFKFYKKFNFNVTGVDISENMLREATKKSRHNHLGASLIKGDIFNLTKQNNKFDLVVCIRFLNWISFNQLIKVLGMISNTSKKYIILGIRVYPGMLNNFSLLSLFRRIKKRIGVCLKLKENLKIHNKNKTLNLFRKNKLRIHNKKVIDKLNDGSVYYIFLLEKNAKK